MDVGNANITWAGYMTKSATRDTKFLFIKKKTNI